METGMLMVRPRDLAPTGRRAVPKIALIALLAMALSGVALAADRTPSRAKVVEVQRLLHELGYPLGKERTGHLGVRTRGALTYFQRKYRLPITGYPSVATLARMRAVAASLRPRPRAPQAAPRDLVERFLGSDAPILTVGVALAVLLALLALSARRDDDSLENRQGGRRR
jgi:peptidoglycan hydrolase-like protein with peptidoglycan-binding domain